MKFVDTHCHLTFSQYDEDRDILIEKIFSGHISWVLNACSHLDDLKAMKVLADKWPDKIYLSIGIHPHYASEVTDKDFVFVENELRNYNYKAIGEVGIDLFRNLSPLSDQVRVFRKFIELAKKYNKALIIHSRSADEKLVKILDEVGLDIVFVVHCFSGDKEFAKKILDKGGYISFTANITYKKSEHIREAAKFAPLDRVMLETDSPYLPPQDRRGKRNDPLAVLEVAKVLAEIKGVSLEQIARITTLNANSFFDV